jgi:hypothetical protein
MGPKSQQEYDRWMKEAAEARKSGDLSWERECKDRAYAIKKKHEEEGDE